MINTYIASLVQYGLRTGMIEEHDKTYITNQILETLGLFCYEDTEPQELPLEVILKGLLDDVVSRGIWPH